MTPLSHSKITDNLTTTQYPSADHHEVKTHQAPEVITSTPAMDSNQDRTLSKINTARSSFPLAIPCTPTTPPPDEEQNNSLSSHQPSIVASQSEIPSRQAADACSGIVPAPVRVTSPLSTVIPKSEALILTMKLSESLFKSNPIRSMSPVSAQSSKSAPLCTSVASRKLASRSKPAHCSKDTFKSVAHPVITHHTVEALPVLSVSHSIAAAQTKIVVPPPALRTRFSGVSPTSSSDVAVAIPLSSHVAVTSPTIPQHVAVASSVLPPPAPVALPVLYSAVAVTSSGLPPSVPVAAHALSPPVTVESHVPPQHISVAAHGLPPAVAVVSSALPPPVTMVSRGLPPPIPVVSAAIPPPVAVSPLTLPPPITIPRMLPPVAPPLLSVNTSRCEIQYRRDQTTPEEISAFRVDTPRIICPACTHIVEPRQSVLTNRKCSVCDAELGKTVFRCPKCEEFTVCEDCSIARFRRLWLTNLPSKRIHGTLFEHALSPRFRQSFDMRELVRLFALKSKKRSAEKKKKAHPLSNVLSLKRISLIEVPLRSAARLRSLSPRALRRAIARDLLSYSEVEMLARMVPTRDEVAALRVFEGDTTTLSLGEQFCLNVSPIPLIFERMQLRMFLNDFRDIQDGVSCDLVTLKRAMTAVHREELTELLSALLQLANLLNHQSDGWGGFNVCSLERVLRARGQSRCSVVQFLANHIMHTNPEIRPALEELLKMISAALEVTVDDLESRLGNISQSLTQIVRYTDELSREDPESSVKEDRFPWAIMHFRERALFDFQAMKREVSAIQTELKEQVVKYSGELPNVSHDEVLTSLKDFILRFLRVNHNIDI
eukprot:228547_1